MDKTLAFAIAQLRHLYQQMRNGAISDTEEAAVGLLGPCIQRLEILAIDLEDERLCIHQAERANACGKCGKLRPYPEA